MSTAGQRVAVVGSGLVGAALAYELATMGVSVVLYDRGEPGRATDAGAGILSPGTIDHPDPAFLALADRSGHHYRTLVERLRADGIADPGYQRCGLLRVAIREGDLQYFTGSAARLESRSPGTLHELTPTRARELYPPLTEVRAALHHPAAARVDGRTLRRALLTAAGTKGVEVVDEDVGSFGRSDDHVDTVVSTAGGRDFDAVALCGGAWSSALGHRLGVDLPVRPLKGQIVHLRLPGADSTAWPIVQPVLGYYLVNWPGGRVACGGTMEEAAGFDTRVTASGVQELIRECLLAAPGLAGATFVEVRVGLRPCTPDDLPVLGALPGVDNVFVATGHGANGLLLGPYSGRLVADQITGRVPPLDLAPFSVGRFESH